eukprot:366536-Chlamydomonas_euryale.AAC.5
MINSYWGGPGGQGAGGLRPCSTWALGYLGTWVLGHLGTWALGHLGTWALGHSGTWQRRRAPPFPAVLRSMPRPASPANACRCRSTIMCFYCCELTV